MTKGNGLNDVDPELACAGTWSGAFQCWGMQHKESPVCVCCNGRCVANNVEIKSMDATANPYIALAAIISAGLLVKSISFPPNSSIFLLCYCQQRCCFHFKFRPMLW